MDFELEESPNCDKDYLEVRDIAVSAYQDYPDGKVLGKYCGKGNDASPEGEILKVMFHTDESVEKMGFTCMYRNA